MTELNLSHTPAIGFDIGGTNIRAVAIDDAGEVIGTSRRPRDEAPEAMMDSVVEIVDELQGTVGETFAAVGMGVAGIVDRKGVVRTSPNIPTLKHFPVRTYLEDRLDRRVVVDNDATTATWAEARTGAGRGYDDVIFAALGTGIGGGLVIDGKIRRGATGFAGEIGHMIVDPQGPLCVCGRTGCWERFASGTALGNQARAWALRGDAPALVEEAGGRATDVQGEHLSALVARSDATALQILDEFGRHVAVGLNNLVNVVDPSIAIIGGGLADIGDALLASIRRGYESVMIDHAIRAPLPIVGAVHGGLAGALGAALLAAD